MAGRDEYVIAQLSDLHCGDARFDDRLMLRVIDRVNESEPDLVVVPGDLTERGYAEQFEEFNSYFNLIECPNRIVIAGNHDCRNVGYVLFERIVGPRNVTRTFDFHPDGGDAKLKLVALDSNIPDLNDGEVGREKIRRIEKEFAEETAFRVLVLHHHLVSIPGTGRERNVVWDAGEILQTLREADVDLVLAGHKHVPYAWPLAGMLIVTSGTASSRRTRGDTSPSYNMIRVGRRTTRVDMIDSAEGSAFTQSFPRRAASPAR